MTGTIEILVTTFVITCVMRLLLELRIGRHKLWSYLLKKDGSDTTITAPFSLLIAMLVVLIILDVLPESAIIFFLLPLLLSLTAKSWRLTSRGRG